LTRRRAGSTHIEELRSKSAMNILSVFPRILGVLLLIGGLGGIYSNIRFFIRAVHQTAGQMVLAIAGILFGCAFVYMGVRFVKNKTPKRPSIFLAASVLLILAIAVCTIFFYTGPANDLGLTRSDLAMGKLPDVEALRTKTKTVADAYLEQHTNDLANISGGTYELTVDYSKSPKIRSLGYHSSFYYYCWDIYLPYTLQTRSGKTFLLAVHLSDAIQGNHHDEAKFHVIGAIVFDKTDQVVGKF
jgi:hypothetical protein